MQKRKGDVGGRQWLDRPRNEGVAIQLKGQRDGRVAARLASLPVCQIFLPLKFSDLSESDV